MKIRSMSNNPLAVAFPLPLAQPNTWDCLCMDSEIKTCVVYLGLGQSDGIDLTTIFTLESPSTILDSNVNFVETFNAFRCTCTN